VARRVREVAHGAREARRQKLVEATLAVDQRGRAGEPHAREAERPSRLGYPSRELPWPRLGG
jgi:hypothetical protein